MSMQPHVKEIKVVNLFDHNMGKFNDNELVLLELGNELSWLPEPCSSLSLFGDILKPSKRGTFSSLVKQINCSDLWSMLGRAGCLP
mmetsp:Transcript_28202/g.39635  ORF Transcript_28202/g.39635 Transcript_28202/m.39635 type:complete len:86 (-) Transcript_28202:7-264(-)